MRLQADIERANAIAREEAQVTAGRRDAELTHKHLMRRVDEFQRTLDTSHELGLRLANFGVAETLHIRAISFRNPNLIEFSGALPDGSHASLVQHISQLSFLLVSVTPLKEEEPYRVGFGASI